MPPFEIWIQLNCTTSRLFDICKLGPSTKIMAHLKSSGCKHDRYETAKIEWVIQRTAIMKWAALIIKLELIR